MLLHLSSSRTNTVQYDRTKGILENIGPEVTVLTQQKIMRLPDPTDLQACSPAVQMGMQCDHQEYYWFGNNQLPSASNFFFSSTLKRK